MSHCSVLRLPRRVSCVVLSVASYCRVSYRMYLRESGVVVKLQQTKFNLALTGFRICQFSVLVFNCKVSVLVSINV